MLKNFFRYFINILTTTICIAIILFIPYDSGRLKYDLYFSIYQFSAI